MSHRSRPRRPADRLWLVGDHRHAPDALIVELAANAPADILDAAEAAASALAPRTAVELVRGPPRPEDEPLRIRGPWISPDAPISAGRRQYRAMAAFAEAFEAALSAAGRFRP